MRRQIRLAGLFSGVILGSTFIFQNCSKFQTAGSDRLTTVASEIPTSVSTGSALNQALGFPTTPSVSALAWQGPSAKVVVDPTTHVASIQVSGKTLSPVFLSVNTQAVKLGDTAAYDQLVREVDLAIQQGGIPVIDVMVKNKGVPALQDLNAHLAGRNVYFILRFDLSFPELNNANLLSYQNQAGVTMTSNSVGYAVSRDGIKIPTNTYQTMDETWLDIEKNNLAIFLGDLNSTPIASKVIALEPMTMNGGEWFERPYGVDSTGLISQNTSQNQFNAPDQIYLSDYSQAEQNLYSQWTQNFFGIAGLTMPSVKQRSTSNYGSAFVTDGARGLDVVRLRKFQSNRVVWLQNEIGRTLKELTNFKALVAVPQGYLLSLASEYGSTHTAFNYLLKSPYIDIINAPYNYSTDGSRKPGFAFIPHGPADSAALYGKIWMHEDDSRPNWYPETFKTTTSFDQDLNLLLRNAATSIIHGNIIYLFDLVNQGWFGGVTHDSEASIIWNRMRTLNTVLPARIAEGNAVTPEVAIFTDGEGFNLVNYFGMDGASSYGTSINLSVGVVEKLTLLGVPVRYYQLSDLENPNLDLSNIKAAFFLHTPLLTTKIRGLIKTKLMNSRRVLYFEHAAGFFDETWIPSFNKAIDFQVGNPTIAQIDSAMTGTTLFQDKVAYTLAYSPKGLNSDQAQEILTRANVHQYISSGVADGAGSILMIHSAVDSQTVTLASRASQVFEVTGNGDSLICSNCQSFMLTGSALKTRIFYIK